MLRGNQEPRLWVAAERDGLDAGHDACDFYTVMTGRTVLPWQRLAVIEILAERWVPADSERRGRWKWAAANAGLVVARQNGKGDVLLIIELYFLFVLKVRRVFHTAQLQKTATDAHARMAQVIRDSPKLLAQVRGGERGIRYGKGDERIILVHGTEILFFTRSDNAGRGLFGDLLICDEAYDLTEGELAALRPLIKTSPAPLVIFTSTPVDKDTMPNGMVLAGVRANALNGQARMTWLEWSVPERGEATGADTRLRDPECWAMANPSLGMDVGTNGESRILLEPETIEDDLNGMGARKFLVEDLCCPDFWPDPAAMEAEEVPFDPLTFGDAVTQAGLMDPIALGIDRSPDGWTSLVAAGWHEDGTWGSETIYHRKGDPGWVLDALDQLTTDFGPAVLVLDATGPAGSLVTKIQAAHYEPIVTGISEMGRAAQALVDDFEGGRYFHRGNDAPLNAAVEICRWRPLGDARAFARKGYGDISPVVAAALAGFGLHLVVAFGKKKPGAALAPAIPGGPVVPDAALGGDLAQPAGASWGAETADLASVGF